MLDRPSSVLAGPVARRRHILIFNGAHVSRFLVCHAAVRFCIGGAKLMNLENTGNQVGCWCNRSRHLHIKRRDYLLSHTVSNFYILYCTAEPLTAAWIQTPPPSLDSNFISLDRVESPRFCKPFIKPTFLGFYIASEGVIRREQRRHRGS